MGSLCNVWASEPNEKKATLPPALTSNERNEKKSPDHHFFPNNKEKTKANYSVLTLESGLINISFSTIEKLLDDIEERTGILTIDQQYYMSGREIKNCDLDGYSDKNLQVVKKNQNSRRFFIKTPSGIIKVCLLITDHNTVKELFLAFISTCSRLSLYYPSDQYAFVHNGQILKPSTLLSTIPADSEINLTYQSVYPVFNPILIKVIDLNGKEFLIDLCGLKTISELKEIISDKEGISGDQIRLIFEGSQLDEGRDISDYNITNSSTVHFVLRLRGGCCPSIFSFNPMESAVKMEFSQTAPKWRIVKEGVSWLGFCANRHCEAFNNEVICNFGYGVFDVNKQINVCVCPLCLEPARNIGGCGFFNCSFSFYGILLSGIKRKGSGEAGPENYTAFLNGQKIDWNALRVQAKKIERTNKVY